MAAAVEAFAERKYGPRRAVQPRHPRRLERQRASRAPSRWWASGLIARRRTATGRGPRGPVGRARGARAGRARPAPRAPAPRRRRSARPPRRRLRWLASARARGRPGRRRAAPPWPPGRAGRRPGRRPRGRRGEQPSRRPGACGRCGPEAGEGVDRVRGGQAPPRIAAVHQAAADQGPGAGGQGQDGEHRPRPTSRAQPPPLNGRGASPTPTPDAANAAVWAATSRRAARTRPTSSVPLLVMSFPHSRLGCERRQDGAACGAATAG